MPGHPAAQQDVRADQSLVSVHAHVLTRMNTPRQTQTHIGSLSSTFRGGSTKNSTACRDLKSRCCVGSPALPRCSRPGSTARWSCWRSSRPCPAAPSAATAGRLARTGPPPTPGAHLPALLRRPPVSCSSCSFSFVALPQRKPPFCVSPKAPGNALLRLSSRFKKLQQDCCLFAPLAQSALTAICDHRLIGPEYSKMLSVKLGPVENIGW